MSSSYSMLIQRARSSKQSPHTHTTLRQSSRSPSRFPTNKTNTGSQNKRPCTHKAKATHANKQSPHTNTLSPHLNHLFPKTRPITPPRGAICLVVAFLYMSPSPQNKRMVSQNLFHTTSSSSSSRPSSEILDDGIIWIMSSVRGPV